jgi:hypothetical protein
MSEANTSNTTSAPSSAPTYKGSCHCGKVQIEVTMDVSKVVSCNCSMCSRRGGLLAFGPIAALKVISGEDAQTDYLFNKKVIHHLFCKTCGIQTFARAAGPDGSPMFAVNVRCLDGVDLDALQVTKYDGKHV